MKAPQWPEFKPGERVCFSLLDGKTYKQVWYLGEFVDVAEPNREGEVPVARVLPYEIAEHFKAKKPAEEWASQALFHFDHPREMVILGRLSNRTTLAEKKASKPVEVPLSNVCQADVGHFLKALVGEYEYASITGARRDVG